MPPTTSDIVEAVERVEVDGVPTLWAPAPGPLTASLVFRVGSADETIPERGICHLIEHAALEQFSGSEFGVNGATELLYTSLHFRGRPDEIVGALADVTTWLRRSVRSAVDGIHHDVLAAEEHERGSGIGRRAVGIVFGHRPWGRAVTPEYGLHALSADDVAAWAERYFHADNARLVLSGPPPDGLCLDLPRGEPLLTTPPVEPVVELPGWFVDTEDGCTLVSLSSRGAVASLTDEVLLDVANERLRNQLGSTYSVGGDRTPLALQGPDSSLSITAFALRPERHAEGVEAFVAVLDELASDGPDPHALERVKRRRARAPEEPGAATGLAYGFAREGLLGDDGTILRSFLDEQFDVTPGEVIVEVASRVDRMLLMAPSKPHDVAGRTPSTVPWWSGQEVSGQRYHPVPGTQSGVELRVSTDGLTLVANEQGDVLTVHFDQCEALLRWDDGSRSLLGGDGVSVTMRAEGWDDLGVLGPWLDQRVGSHLIIDMGGREPLHEHAEAAEAARQQTAAQHGDGQQSHDKSVWQRIGKVVFVIWVLGVIGRLVSAVLN